MKGGRHRHCLHLVAILVAILLVQVDAKSHQFKRWKYFMDKVPSDFYDDFDNLLDERTNDDKESPKLGDLSEGTDQGTRRSADWDKTDKQIDAARKGKDVTPTTTSESSVASQADEFVHQLPEDACSTVFCAYGRICAVESDGGAVCVCAGAEFCRGHSKRTCGTDGVWYPSHCELHRQACLTSAKVKVDHTERVCKRRDKEQRDAVNKRLSTPGKQVQIEQNKFTQTKVTDPTNSPTTSKKSSDLENNLQPANQITPSSDANSIDEQIRSDLGATDPKKGQSKQGENTHGDTNKAGHDGNVVYVDSMKTLPPLCTKEEYVKMKESLLEYHCIRIGEQDCSKDHARTQFTANIMFSYFDHNSDSNLDLTELRDSEQRDSLGKLSQFCHLTDLLVNEDINRDQQINIAEFYRGFNVSRLLLDDRLKEFTTVVTVGNSVELQCDIKGAAAIVWKRNGGLLADVLSDEIRTYEDGMMYISNIGLHHMGNYTCQDLFNPAIVQTHNVLVQMPPRVRVDPVTQFHSSGSSASLRCHAVGIPQARVSWSVNEQPIIEDPDRTHYALQYNNVSLEIRNTSYKTDTGAYKCTAVNQAGLAEDIATVFIDSVNTPPHIKVSAGDRFLVFHSSGYTVFDPEHCHTAHQVSPSFDLFQRLPLTNHLAGHVTLCVGECVWGGAVLAGGQMVYVSQPLNNRVVIIHMERANPTELVWTDSCQPVQLHYIEKLDQIWIQCWQVDHPEDRDHQIVMVIRDASKDVGHSAARTAASGGTLEKISNLYVAPSGDLGGNFLHGYVSMKDKTVLYKLDLQTTKYTHMIDLKEYNCVPRHLAFIVPGGQVLVSCVGSGRLTLDYLTDRILSQSPLAAVSHVSPDQHHLVTVDSLTNTITVDSINDRGELRNIFIEYTSFHMSDLSFFPSDRGFNYDLYATSVDRNDVLFIDLMSGKVELIEGVGSPGGASPWGLPGRPLVTGDVFSQYLLTPSTDVAVALNGRQRRVQCEWPGVKGATAVVWVRPQV